MRNLVLRLISSFDIALTALWFFNLFLSFSLTTIDWFLLIFIVFQFCLPHKSNGVFSSPKFLKFQEKIERLRFPSSAGSSETMASSQVEIASNSSPFGYVLKDINRHSTRDSFNSFQKNFVQKNSKDLVQTHLNSCISGHSKNSGSGSFIDYTDLWVHSPQNNNANDFHSRNSGSNIMSGLSDFNENSEPHIDYTDLWVHDPQRNNNENVMKKIKGGEKCDKARNMVFASDKKISKSLPGIVRRQDDASSGPVSSLQRRKNPDHLSSGPVSTASPKGRFQESASSEAVLASDMERRPDNVSASGPVSTSQRGRNWEVLSSRLFPVFQRRKSQDGTASGPDSRSQRGNSPESSVELPSSRGVSSLLQKWKDMEAEAKSLSATNSPVCTSRSNSVMFFMDNESLAEAPGGSSDACEEFVDLMPATPAKSEDLFLDWESDQTGISGPPSTRGGDSDATEKDKISVADIIKKLSSNCESHDGRDSTLSYESLPRIQTSVDKSELRTFSPVAGTPRIRGRQAFVDVLMQMERDRQRELEGLAHSKPVSRFSHRGRIQAMLRVRFLRHEGGGKDAPRTSSTPSESSRLAQSSISDLRQRFNEGVQLTGTDSRSQKEEELVDITQQGKKSSAKKIEENHHKEQTEQTKFLNFSDNSFDAQKVNRTNEVLDFDRHDAKAVVQQNDHQQHGSEIFHQEYDSTSDVTQQGTNSEYSNVEEALGFTLEETSVRNNLGSECSHIEERKNKELIVNSNEYMDAIDEAQGDSYMEETNTHQNLEVSDCSQEADVSHPINEWDEIEDYYEPQEESNQDWIWDVSRPRSTWEDLRQARYQEMLDPFMENDDICELLKRKSVSSFLSSGLKDSIDRLMMSRVQQPPSPTVSRVTWDEGTNHVEEREETQNVEMKEEQKQFDEGRQVDEKKQIKTDECEKDKEGKIHSENECIASNDDAGQATSSDNNQEDYFRPSSFPSPQESYTSNSSSPETQPTSSFTNHPSIEMQFMYDMRGNMEQLHQEISELRRSIKSCMSMQMKLQKSIAWDATGSSCLSGRKKRRRDSPTSKKSSRGRCCMCSETQIDSLLYRCGHMCTCFKCAENLQWSSGKCPICQAPIIDVVRAYACP